MIVPPLRRSLFTAPCRGSPAPCRPGGALHRVARLLLQSFLMPPWRSPSLCRAGESHHHPCLGRALHCAGTEEPCIMPSWRNPSLRHVTLLEALLPRGAGGAFLPRGAGGAVSPCHPGGAFHCNVRLFLKHCTAPPQRSSSSRHTRGSRDHLRLGRALHCAVPEEVCTVPAQRRPSSSPLWRSPSPHHPGGGHHRPCHGGALNHATLEERFTMPAQRSLLSCRAGGAPHHRAAPEESIIIVLRRRSPLT